MGHNFVRKKNSIFLCSVIRAERFRKNTAARCPFPVLGPSRIARRTSSIRPEIYGISLPTSNRKLRGIRLKSWRNYRNWKVRRPPSKPKNLLKQKKKKGEREQESGERYEYCVSSSMHKRNDNGN